jgi:predicted Zn-dependent protease
MSKSFEKISEIVREHCTAEDYTFAVTEKDSHETRFAGNAVTQHITGKKTTLLIEVAFGDCSGSAQTNQLDADAIVRTIRTAEEIARCTQPDPEFMPSQTAQVLPAGNAYSEDTAQLTGADLTQMVAQGVAFAEKRNAIASGMVERHIEKSFVRSRNGFAGSSEETVFSFSMTMKQDERETKVSQAVKDMGDFDIEHQLGQLGDQFDSLQGRVPLESGRMPVILRPGAVMDLFAFMTYGMRRRETDEGLTSFAGKIGTQCFGERFSMLSTFAEKDLTATPFGMDCIPNRETAWIDHGVLTCLPVDRYWAQKTGLEPLNMFNIYIPGEDTDEEAMMQMVPRGVIVNRLWYIREVDRRTGEYTGITRDGVVYFENGKRKHAVNNMRFNEIPYDCTRRLLALGPSILMDNTMKIPAMLIDNFNFVDTTSF